MSAKRVGAGGSFLPTAQPPNVRRSKRGRVEHIVSQSFEGSAPDVRKASPLKNRHVTFASSVKLSVEEIQQIQEKIRHAIDLGMPELIEEIGRIPPSCTPELLNQDSREPTFPISYATEKLKNQPIPIEIFAALFETGFRPTCRHIFSLWSAQNVNNGNSIADISCLFLTKMQKEEIVKTVRFLFEILLKAEQEQLAKDLQGSQWMLRRFESLVGSILKKGSESFAANVVLGFKEVSPLELEQALKVYDFDLKLLEILFQNLTLALEGRAPLCSIRALVEIICTVAWTNMEHSFKLGQSLLLKYLKTEVNLETLAVVLSLPLPIQIDSRLLGEAMQGCAPEVQALLKQTLMSLI